MITNRGNSSVVGQINQGKQDLRNATQSTNATLKDHTSAIGTLQNQATAAAATTSTVNGWKTNFSTTNATTTNTTVTNQITGPGNKPLYNWSGDGAFPIPTDPNTGSSWATGERVYINNCVGLVNYIYQVLVDAGILAS